MVIFFTALFEKKNQAIFLYFDHLWRIICQGRTLSASKVASFIFIDASMWVEWVLEICPECIYIFKDIKSNNSTGLEHWIFISILTNYI